MNNKNENISDILFELEKISNQLKILVPIYNKFFNIEEIFSSENGGKTRLNRQVFNETHEQIQESILVINQCLNDSLDILREKLNEILTLCGELNKIELINLIFDDESFIQIIEMNLKNRVISKELKNKYIKDISNLLILKNRLFNLKYLLDMFNTDIFDKNINKMGIEDLINSTVIFEIIDSYALQFEELKKFEYEINNLNHPIDKITKLNNLNYLLELHKRRIDNFIYANVRYKIFIDYNVETKLNKPIYLNTSYLENILSCFIEQSCMDVIKKELKKGKIQKNIELNIIKNKKDLQIIVKNNGFEIKNIYNLFLSDVDNKYILEAKNLTSLIDGKLEILSSDEGVTYILTL